jgi:succinate dehydrogenase / fumarate reductase cytochrome b subunit
VDTSLIYRKNKFPLSFFFFYFMISSVTIKVNSQTSIEGALMWFVRFLSSSIGKKTIMAVTGLLLVLFLCTHVAGNSTIFLSSHDFQGYADTLHSFPLLVLVFSLSLLGIFLIHIGVGLFLFFENRQEGNSRYAVNTSVVKNSFASETMPYTGMFILVFLFVHIFGFTFSPSDVAISITVKELLGNFFYSLFYVLAFVALTIHLSHGFWSMLQTFGVNHPRYNVLISRLTYVIPLFFLLIFGGIAFYFMTGLGANY